MADMSRIKENIGRMIDGGASEEEIDQYVSLEGLSVDDLSKKDSSMATGLVGSVAAAGVAGLGLKAAKDAFFSPATEIKQRDVLLKNMKVEYLNEPDISSFDLPTRIKLKGEEISADLETKKQLVVGRGKKIASAERRLKSSLRQSLDDFDDEILNKSIDEMTTTMKKSFPKYVNNTYNNYGKILKGAEDTLIKSGKKIKSDVFINEVLNQSIDDAIKAGVPEEKLTKLISFRNHLSEKGKSPIIDGKGKPFFVGKQASVEQFKGNVRFLSNDVPKEAAFKIRSNWGKFLERNAPEVGGILKEANLDYAEFARLRNALYKTVDDASGEFDRNKMNRMLQKYANSKVKTGIEEQVRLMAEGSRVSTPDPEVGVKFSNLAKAKKVKAGIKAAGESKISKAGNLVEKANERVRSLKNKIRQSRKKTLAWHNKSQKILSEQKGIAERHPIRAGMRGKAVQRGASVGAHAGISSVVKSSMRVFSFYPVLSSIVRASIDPEKAFAEQMGVGEMVPAKGTKERALLENIVNKEPIPKELEMSEKEKEDTLISWGYIL